MKLKILFLFFMFAFHSYGQQEYLLREGREEEIVEEIKKESNNPKHSEEERKLLGKIADRIIKFSSVMTKSKTSRKIGMGASFVATQTARPFANASAFMTALFEKRPNSEIPLENIYQFFLIHEPSFREFSQEAGTIEELVEKIYEEFDHILVTKEEIIIKDILKLTQGDLDLLKPSMINEHPEFQDIKLLIGELNEEDIEIIISEEELNFIPSIDGLEEMLKIKIHEVVTTILGQTLLTTKVISIVSGIFAKVYGVVVVSADLLAGLSAVACVANEDVRSKIDIDHDIKNFCSYVVVQSAYKLARSRAKGYVAGKRVRAKTLHFIEKTGLKKKKSN